MTRKTLLAYAACVVLCLGVTQARGCRGWPEANQDVRELRAIHREYRDNTVAKNASDTANVEALASKIDSIFGRLDDLTK